MKIRTASGDELYVALEMDIRLKVIADSDTLCKGSRDLTIIDATDAERKLLAMSGWEFKEPGKPPLTIDEYFGACPLCGKSDGYMNVGPQHYGICDAHQTAWPIGNNLFSDWRDEAPEIWEDNERMLAGCIIVRPIHEEPGPAGAETPEAMPRPVPDDEYPF